MNYKYKYKLSNLDCPNCARKIETALNKCENIKSASVNFAKLEVNVETSLKSGVKKIVEKTVKATDADVKVLDLNSKDNKKIIFDITRLILGITLFIISLFIKNNLIKEVFIILAYLILLFRVLKKAILMLIKSFNIDENLLVSISCIGAYFTNNISEGLMVIILYEIGKILESIAVNNSRKSISELMDIKPDYANLLINDEIKVVSPESVKIDDLILIKKGEKIPLDGVVVKGMSKIDNKALTGESRLVSVGVNDVVFSGGINTSDILTLKVTKTYENSTVANILSLVENATDRKAKTENFVSKAAKIYTPIILGLAISLTIVLTLIFKMPFNDAIYRSLVFLVVSCPCAIAISVPLSYFSGIGASSREGILIKGSDYLEASSKIKEIIFDKTGTLTDENNKSIEIEYLDLERYIDDINAYLVSGEEYSNHPIAKAIVKELKDAKHLKITKFKEYPGEGISYNIGKKKIMVGTKEFVKKDGFIDGTYMVIDNLVAAKINVYDGLKDNAYEVINDLQALDIKTMMFTGDKKDIALSVSEKLGIDECHYELLPQDKFDLLNSELNKYNGNVAFVGDGINDAPSLALAKVGISMGSIGSASAIEASDIVIMNDNLDSIIKLIKISKKTNKIIKQNLIFAIGTKVLVLLLSAFGIATMWEAVFADTGVTLLTILNTTRILKKKC